MQNVQLHLLEIYKRPRIQAQEKPSIVSIERNKFKLCVQLFTPAIIKKEVLKKTLSSLIHSPAAVDVHGEGLVFAWPNVIQWMHS